MKKQEIIICNRPDAENAQMLVKLFPKRKINVRKTKKERKITNQIDIVEIWLKDIDGNENPIQMTPDEALELSGLISQAISVYLTYFNKEYKKNFIDKIDNLRIPREKS